MIQVHELFQAYFMDVKSKGPGCNQKVAQHGAEPLCQIERTYPALLRRFRVMILLAKLSNVSSVIRTRFFAQYKSMLTRMCGNSIMILLAVLSHTPRRLATSLGESRIGDAVVTFFCRIDRAGFCGSRETLLICCWH